MKYLLLILCLLFAGCRVDPDEQAWSTLLKGIRTAFPDVEHITTAELDGWLQDASRKPPLLLDTREKEEFGVSHIAGAQLASNHALTAYAKDQPIVTYCSVGARSAAMARELKKQGYNRVYNLEGSIFQWFNEGRPVVRDGRPVQEVHPFDDHWGRFLKNHERARKSTKE